MFSPCQWLICSTLDSHTGHIVISGSYLLKYWRTTHFLDACSGILISGSHLLNHQRATHFLHAYSIVLISDYHLLKHCKVTHILDMCSAILISCYDPTLESNSQPECSFLSVVPNLFKGTTHILNVFPIYLIRKFLVHILQSYHFALQKTLISFQ